jgi:hypothetical protein
VPHSYPSVSHAPPSFLSLLDKGSEEHAKIKRVIQLASRNDSEAGANSPALLPPLTLARVRLQPLAGRPNSSTLVLFDAQQAGGGAVTALHFHLPQLSQPQLEFVYLTIKFDDEAVPAVDSVPLRHAFSAELAPAAANANANANANVNVNSSPNAKPSLIMIPNPVRGIAMRRAVFVLPADGTAAAAAATAAAAEASKSRVVAVMSITAPMPYWKSARISIHTSLETSVDLAFQIESVAPCPYDPAHSAMYRIKQTHVRGVSKLLSTNPPTLLEVPRAHWGHLERVNFAAFVDSRFFESDFTFKFDGARSVQIHETGTEDYFLSSHRFRFGSPSAFVGHGVTKFAVRRSTLDYQFFLFIYLFIYLCITPLHTSLRQPTRVTTQQ